MPIASKRTCSVFPVRENFGSPFGTSARKAPLSAGARNSFWGKIARASSSFLRECYLIGLG